MKQKKINRQNEISFGMLVVHCFHNDAADSILFQRKQIQIQPKSKQTLLLTLNSFNFGVGRMISHIIELPC